MVNKILLKFIFVARGIMKTLILILAICGACSIYNSFVYRNSVLKRKIGNISVEAIVDREFDEGRVVFSTGKSIDNVIQIANIGSLLACVRFKENLDKSPYLIIDLNTESIFEFDDIKSFFMQLNLPSNRDCFESVLNFVQVDGRKNDG